MTLESKKRTFVLGIDGMPYSFLQKRFAQGKMSNLKKLAREFKIKRINSVYPTISSVAWTSYTTGKNPAQHSIFGFVDRIANPFQIKIPTARDRKAQTIWSELSRQNKRVIVINVPLTYPPERINGILVCGFLCADIEKSSYPPEYAQQLKAKNYIIDVDANLARNNQKRKFMEQLHQAMEKRFLIALELAEREEWNFFQLHIMETDRLFHFFWDDTENQGAYSEDLEKFFEKLDRFVADLCRRLSDKDRLLILSDHGFCKVKYEVQLNLWLEEQGFLKFEKNAQRKLINYAEDSFCYSLIPGRIFINLEGREEKGTVHKNDYESLCQEIKARLLDFKNSENGERIIDKVFFREEIYHGPYLENSADIIAHPVNGYDLKGKVDADDIFDSSALCGMHTYDDAFVLGMNLNLDSVETVQDIKNKVINY